MSRSGYTNEEDWSGQFALYRANVSRAIAGRRGQAFLVEMAAALDAMPKKELAAGILVEPDGEVCAMGAVAVARGKTADDFDEDAINDPDAMGAEFGIAPCMAAEIANVNDDDFRLHSETPEQRWKRVRKWVADQNDDDFGLHSETPEQRWKRVRKWVADQLPAASPEDARARA